MRGYNPRGYDDYGSGGGGGHHGGGGGGHGQMVINMKTTVTTSGGQHNGLVVHSAVQSAGSPSTSQGSWMPSYSDSPSRRLDDRLDMIRSNTSLHRSSPLPIQMVPSTSRETLVSIGRRNEERRPPSPPPSPVYAFKGRDSPPDEFIQPTKLVLNVFRPKSDEPTWQTPISRSHVALDQNTGGIQLSKKNALLNDALTTTTTVEVFRAPLDPDTPLISLTPSPYGGNPLLIRAHGPAYEQWNGQTRQNLMDGEAQMAKGVQWKERLIEESDRRYRDNDDYDEIAPLPDNSVQYINHDYRPKPFQPVTHPMIMSHSREDLRSQPPPYPAPLSPLYIVPDRQRHEKVSPGQWSRRSNGFRESELRDNEQNVHRERYHRRSKSSTREEAPSIRSVRHRSSSPGSRRSVNTFGGSQEFVLPAHSPIGSTLMLASPDPNELPGRPASARSQEIFALYQTRDAYNRIVDLE